MMKTYIGIDIGGTNLRIAVLRGLRPQRVRAFALPTPRGRKALEAVLRRRVGELVAALGKPAGIGISVAGVVSNTGRVIVAEHLAFLNGWDPLFLERRLRIPVLVENDARCFLAAEAAWGSGRRKKHIVGVVIGTGIGGAVMINGRIWRGAHRAAGEIGKVIMRYDLGHRGAISFEELGAKDAAERWGDRSVFIGVGIANIINTLDPAIVVIGGGAMSSGGLRLPIVRQVARRYTVAPAARRTPIVPAALGDAAPAIGAALLFK